MALTGSTTEEKIWNYLKAQGLSEYGVAGLMGNLYAESGLSSTNLQNTYEKKLGYTDATYTAAVDNGKYTNFAKDSAGYGLAQWTYWSRKQALLAYATAAKKSIGDLETQLAFLMKELGESYKTVLAALKSATTVQAASDSVLLNFEKPANQGSTVKAKRAQYGQAYYDKYATKKGGAATTMSNSSLTSYTKISPNRTSPRKSTIKKITIHHMAGNLSIETCGGVFASTSRKASANYGIGTDGRIGMYVEEKDRAWTSSNADNDNQAVTIEVANDTLAPNWTVSDKAMTSLINLCVDICKRNGIAKLNYTGDKTGNLTMHKWFASTACPGPYLEGKFSYIAEQVNKKLGVATTTTTTTTTTSTTSSSTVPRKVRITASVLNIRSGPGTTYKATGQIKDKGVYTITEESNGWGKLKSGAGWISLAYTKNV